MNILEHYVVEVMGEPEKLEMTLSDGTLDVWFDLVVKADCYGSVGQHHVSFNSLEEAKAVQPGYIFMA